MMQLPQLLEEMNRSGASDLYLLGGSPPKLRIQNRFEDIINTVVLDYDTLRDLTRQALTPEQLSRFYQTNECNTSLNPELGAALSLTARYRVSAYIQQGQPAMVIRRITTEIPTLESLGLPPLYGRLAMEPRGLVIICGATGSGKSSTIAALTGLRNASCPGHIVTVEDPVEFIHTHQRSLVTQREIGLDTESYETALKNVLRQRPDMVVIGEIRDRETMEQALYIADSGHLCLTSFHAANAYQTIERVLNLFPREQERQIRMTLASTLNAICSQRLLPSSNEKLVVARETMLNRGLITKLIASGNLKEITDLIAKSTSEGMQSYEQSLLEMYTNGIISENTALDAADNPQNMMLAIRQATSWKKQSQEVHIPKSGTPTHRFPSNPMHLPGFE